MLNKECYKKAALVIVSFENDRIHTDINASGPVSYEDRLPVIGLGSPISGLSDLQGQRDTFGS